MSAMLDPHGRLGPAAFREAALTLIGIGAVISLVPWVAPSLTFWTFISVVLVYPWGVIWVKRFHDAGKSGWMFLPVFVVWLIITWGTSYVITKLFGTAPIAQPTDFSSAMTNAAAQAEALALPNTIVSSIISFVFVLVGNALLKSDPGPNAYDPPPHMR